MATISVAIMTLFGLLFGIPIVLTVARILGFYAIVEERTRSIPDQDLSVLGYWDWLSGLERGVAAHHAGLLPAFKEVVEELFQKKLVKALRAQGVSLDDATIAAGGPADGSAGIVAIRVPGADIRKLGPVLVQAIGGRMLKGEPSPAVVGAREAFLIQDSGGTTGYAHPSGDVLWMVFGQTETGIAIAFAALP